MPPESLVCLDLEFDIQDHYVHEIAMCTLLSNEPKVLIDAVTKIGAKPPKPSLRKNLRHPFVKEIATVRQRNREDRTRRRATAGRILNTKQIVEKLRLFIEPDTIILTWHVNAVDLTILKDFLEANGHETASILPPKDNCVFMVPRFRRNLRIRKTFRWKVIPG